MQAHRERTPVRCSGHVGERPLRGGELVYTLRLRIDGGQHRVTLGTGPAKLRRRSSATHSGRWAPASLSKCFSPRLNPLPVGLATSPHSAR
jgi:hypothetical protein